MGENQHGATTWMVAQRSKIDWACTAWSLENADVPRCSAHADHVTAPCVFNGPINGECFLLYVEQFLVPTLKPNDIVIMDNLGSHKSQAIRIAIAKAGARVLFLPPYSPDLNPIEQVFSTLKNTLRKAMGRSIEAIEAAIAKAITAISKQESQNYLTNAGYASV